MDWYVNSAGGYYNKVAAVAGDVSLTLEQFLSFIFWFCRYIV